MHDCLFSPPQSGCTIIKQSVDEPMTRLKPNDIRKIQSMSTHKMQVKTCEFKGN